MQRVAHSNDGDGEERDPMERRLYLARKQFERAMELGEVTGYVCSLSAKTIVYKSLCLGTLLADFYPDLASPEFVTNFAIFHQRYATNTLPAWHRAQPARKLGHNGEINTVWGNRGADGCAWIDAAGGVPAGVYEGRDGLDEPG